MDHTRGAIALINGIHHVAIVVRDYDRMLAFYTEAVGFEVAFHAEWDENTPLSEEVLGLKGSAGQLTALKAGNAYLELHEYRKPVDAAPLNPDNRPCDQGIRHICLDVTDIDEVYERLMAAGMRFPSPPSRIDGIDIRTVYARDPDGNLVEIQEILTSASGLALSALPKLLPGAWLP